MNESPARPVPDADVNKPHRVRPAELLAVTAAFAAWVVVMPMLAALSARLPPDHAWSRPLTGDEFHTLLLIQEPSPTAMIAKLAKGGDFNPPALFLALRPWTALFGSDEASLRLFSSTAMIVGLLGLYVALRGGIDRVSAFAATVATWGGLPLLQVEAVDARFYALWFAATAWLAAMMPAVTRFAEWRSLVVAALSIVVCTTHYFGVISLACLVVGQLLLDRFAGRTLGGTLLRLSPVVAGPIALAACLPLYFGQRAALEVPTWIAPSGRAAIEQLIDPFFRSFTLSGAALAIAATIAWRSLRRERIFHVESIDVRRLGAALGLVAMPLLMLAFQFAVQPASVARYAIPAAIGVAAATGVLLACCDRRIAIGCAIAFLLLPVATLRLQTDLWNADRQHAPGRLAQSLTEHMRADRPLVFTQRSAAYAAWHDGGVPADAVRIAVLSDGDEAGVFERVERSVGGRLHDLFGTPAPIGRRDLAVSRSFIFCSEQPLHDIERQLPKARVGRIAESGPLIAYLVVPDTKARAADDRR